MNEFHTLYRFYSESHELLYVGITNNPATRFGQHKKEKPWWIDITSISMSHFDTRQAVLDAERMAIIEESPRYNIVHNGANPLSGAIQMQTRAFACGFDVPSQAPWESSWMPDFCEGCADSEFHYPHQWDRGIAHYMCGHGHAWTSGWAHYGTGTIADRGREMA